MRGRPEQELGANGQPISALGATVRAWRKHRDLSVTALAIKAALGPNGRGYISQIEHGKIRHPNDEHIRRIAEALGVGVSDLLLHRGPESAGARASRPLNPLAPGRSTSPDTEAPDHERRLLGAIERLERVVERLADLVSPLGLMPIGDTRAEGPARGRPGEVQHRRAFVGRERELRVILERFELACSGRGQVVLVTGEAGIGKSRLLRELRQRLRRASVTWLEGRCRADRSGIAYLPLIEIAKLACGVVPEDSPAAIARKVRATLQELDAEPNEWAPYLTELLGVPARTDRMAALAPEAIQSQTFAGLRRLLLASSRRGPLMVVVEDLHWVDQASEAYLTAFADALADGAIVLLCTHRPGYEPAWIGRAAMERIELRPLTADDSLRVLDTMPTRERTEPVTDVILGRADGNPLFLEELSWVVGEQSEAGSEYAALDTLPSVLKVRIAHLADRARAVLQAASVLGYVFPVRLLGAIWDGPGPFRAELEELRRLELLFENADRDEPAYAFKHPLVHDVAYQSLPAPRRRALHGAAGRAIEALYADRLEEHDDLLAYHYARSVDADKALVYLSRAHQKAVNANAMVEATAYYRQAMTRLDAEPDIPERREQRIVLLISQAPAMHLLMKFPEYYEDLRRYAKVAAGLGDPGLDGLYKASMAWCEWQFGWFDQAIGTATEAAHLCESAQSAEGAAMSYVNLQWDHLYRGDLAQAQEMERKVYEKLSQRYNVRWHYFALLAASLASTWLGRWEPALDAGRAALRLGEEFLNDSMISEAAFALALAGLHQGAVDQGESWATLALEKAVGPFDELLARAILGSAWIRGGQAGRGVPALAEALVRLRAVRNIGGEHLALYLADGYCLLGDYDGALQALDEHLRIAESGGMKLCIGASYRRMGEIAMAAESAQAAGAAATTHFEQSIAVLGEIGAENELALAYASYGRLLQRLGDLAQGRGFLAKALEIFERLENLVEADEVRRALAGLAAEQHATTNTRTYSDRS